MSFLPHKSVLLALCGLLIIGAAFAISFSGNRIKYGEADSSFEVIKRAQQVAAAQATKQDSDEDGLRDWEETLWGTDPANPDTDGDGDTDGREVDENRNPTLAGPDDALEVDEVTGEVVYNDEPTETDKLAGEFFSKYLTLRQRGQLNSVTAQEELFGILSQALPSSAESASLLSREDMLIGRQTGTAAAKTYGNVVGAIIANHSLQNENEAVILLRALEQNDPNVLQPLESIEDAYGNMVHDLKRVVIPKDAEAVHLELLNSLAAIEKTTQDMQLAFTDPVVMLGAVNRYQAEATRLLHALIGVQTYLRNSGAAFSSEEPGNLLMTIVTIQ